MTIDAASLNIGATSVGPTGGTATALSLIGGAKPGSSCAAFDTDTTKISRRLFTFTPVPAPTSKSSVTGYGKERRFVTIKWPVEVSTGVYEDAIFKGELAEPVTVSSAIITEHTLQIAQVFSNSALNGFFTLGNTG